MTGLGCTPKIGKTVIMAFQPYHAIWGHSMNPYGLRMTGDHLSHGERLRQRAFCPEFDIDLTEGSLETHQHNQHGVGRGF